MGKVSEFSRECVSGSTPWLSGCGDIGWLPVDPLDGKVSGVSLKPGGYLSCDGPGSFGWPGWGKGGGRGEREPTTGIGPTDPVGGPGLGGT
jgi:hypothetical protein